MSPTPTTTTRPGPSAVVQEINRRRRLAKLTVFQAAHAAQVSEAQWRLYTAGHRTTRGVTYAVTPKDDALARMANAVGMRPDELATFPETAQATRLLAVMQRPSWLTSLSDEELLAELARRLQTRASTS